jgi:hypothetical protein
MGFNSSGQEFDIRKHGNALITGALSGVALGLAMAQGSQVSTDELTSGQFIFGVFLIFLSAVGIDKLRSNTSQMVTGVKSIKIKPTTPTPTPTPPSLPATKEEVK